MARSNPGFEKRLREQKKRQKKAEKARKKADRDAAKTDGTPLPDDDVVVDRMDMLDDGDEADTPETAPSDDAAGADPEDTATRSGTGSDSRST